MELSDMTPKRPYLMRALYDWIVDNQLTPHLVVDATIVGTKVPQQFVCPTKIQYCTVTEYNLVKIIKTKCYIKGSESHRTYGNYIISHVSSEY